MHNYWVRIRMSSSKGRPSIQKVVMEKIAKRIIHFSSHLQVRSRNGICYYDDDDD